MFPPYPQFPVFVHVHVDCLHFVIYALFIPLASMFTPGSSPNLGDRLTTNRLRWNLYSTAQTQASRVRAANSCRRLSNLTSVPVSERVMMTGNSGHRTQHCASPSRRKARMISFFTNLLSALVKPNTTHPAGVIHAIHPLLVIFQLESVGQST